MVAGPDAYRDLPRLLADVDAGAATAMNVQLSLEETYADVAPVRPAGAKAAFVSITRGCNNMCSFCIVPFTR
jgi:tRNA-2-methylthio-N6-dimethylallyladenosine synthase